MKRKVKKKLLPRPEDEGIWVSLSSPLPVGAPGFAPSFLGTVSFFGLLWR
jgi:hypothetical protein